MTFKRAKKILIIEIKDKGISNNRIYKRALEIFDDNEELADKFMTSKFGGFTRGEVNSIKYQIDRNIEVYHKPKEKEYDDKKTRDLCYS